ncbi:hypothetical protein EDD11_003122 [Mortierella claussenii]|nr:hypothetical protein EDD11_003122 [Mortierella claussenii]
MEHINGIFQQEGYPIVVEHSAIQGNHAKASRDIPQGEGLLRAIPYAAEAFDNYRKRMCHVCLLYHNRGAFSFRCQDCDQVYFCSAECKAVAMDPRGGAHGKVCKTLRKLATWNSDRHTKSIIKLLLQVLMSHWRERQGIPTAYQSRMLMLAQSSRSRKSDIDYQSDMDNDGKGKGDSDDNVENGLDLGQEVEKKLTVTAAVQEIEQAAVTGATESQDVQAAAETTEAEAEQQQRRNRIQEPIENDFYDFLRLQSHYEDWDEEDNKDWKKQSYTVLSLLEMAGLTEMATERGTTTEMRLLTVQDIKQLISALESNAFGMFDRSKSKPVCFGRAIYPVASFFNHSCDCNSTAVQADGSAEEVTGGDVLDIVSAESEEACKANEQLAEQATTSTTASTVTTLTSASAPESTLSLQAQSNTAAKDSTEDITTEADAASDGSAVAVMPDPYDLRVGEFRMMTFFAIKNIAIGQDITISYIDTDAPLQARRLALLSDYHFHCCCERCLREENATGSAKKDLKSGGSGRKKKDKKKFKNV